MVNGLEEVMRRKRGVWLAAAALVALLWCGCAGIISESFYDGGKAERLRLSSGDKWSNWDRNPTKQDESCLMFKKESTF
jgi:hypothetical protein